MVSDSLLLSLRGKGLKMRCRRLIVYNMLFQCFCFYAQVLCSTKVSTCLEGHLHGAMADPQKVSCLM